MEKAVLTKLVKNFYLKIWEDKILRILKNISRLELFLWTRRMQFYNTRQKRCAQIPKLFFEFRKKVHSNGSSAHVEIDFVNSKLKIIYSKTRKITSQALEFFPKNVALVTYNAVLEL